jgi:hypothetical protein
MKIVRALCALLVLLVASPERLANADTAPAPAFTSSGELVRPADYREWVFLTSGLGMTYGPAKPRDGEPKSFDNVFVTRPAYRQFLQSGTWPQGTMFVLEIRRGEANVSINNDGRTQGRIVALEAAVKDARRFPAGGWGYFSFDVDEGPGETTRALPASESCYTCHRANTAVDNTFVQFYPTLLEVAQRLRTIRKDYDPKKKAG